MMPTFSLFAEDDDEDEGVAAFLLSASRICMAFCAGERMAE